MSFLKSLNMVLNWQRSGCFRKKHYEVRALLFVIKTTIFDVFLPNK